MLIRQIEKIRNEKCTALDLAEKEEEYLTNMMTKKLQQLQKEKISLENAMEAEQEYMINKLYRHIENICNAQKRHLINDSMLPPSLDCVLKEIRSLEGKITEKEQLLSFYINHIVSSKHQPSEDSDCPICGEMMPMISQKQ